jgi:hypothetical protein
MITNPVAGALGRGAACTLGVVADVDGTTGSGFGAASSAEVRRAIPAAMAAVMAAAQAMIRATLTGRSRAAATDGVFGLSVICPP